MAVPIASQCDLFHSPTVWSSVASGNAARRFGCGRRQQVVLERARRSNERQPAFERAPHEQPGNQQAVDLVGALEDPVHTRVAVVPLGGVVADEAVAAMDLDVLVEDVVQHLAAGDFQDRRLDCELLERSQHGIRRAALRAAAPSMSPAVR